MPIKQWTEEEIAALKTTEEVKSLLANAVRKGNAEVVARCESEIAKRTPPKPSRKSSQEESPSRLGQVISEYHFVCPRGKGVTTNQDGTAWTCTWVVDKAHVKKSREIGAHVALHASKAEPSYFQGIIKDWRRSKRENQYAEDRETKIEYGIDFLLELTDQPFEWFGDGAGEKGYRWVTVAS